MDRKTDAWMDGWRYRTGGGIRRMELYDGYMEAWRHG
jgi:hypothetical protein